MQVIHPLISRTNILHDLLAETRRVNILHLHAHATVSEREDQARSRNRATRTTLALSLLDHQCVKRLLTRTTQTVLRVRVRTRRVELVLLRFPARLVILDEQFALPFLQAVNEPETLTPYALRLP